MKISTIIEVLFIVFVTCAGCNSGEISQEAELKTIIAKYNIALVEAYGYQFFEPLKEVAGEDEVGKVEIIIDSYMLGNQIMEAQLNRMDFNEINIEEDRATVRTSEDWSYRWVDLRTGEEVEPLRDIHYELLYHLIKNDDKWLVEKVGEVEGAQEG